jgi:hypothetical protein
MCTDAGVYMCTDAGVYMCTDAGVYMCTDAGVYMCTDLRDAGYLRFKGRVKPTSSGSIIHQQNLAEVLRRTHSHQIHNDQIEARIARTAITTRRP